MTPDNHKGERPYTEEDYYDQHPEEGSAPLADRQQSEPQTPKPDDAQCIDCNVDHPYKEETMAGGLLCIGCGRTKSNVKYVLAKSEPQTQGMTVEDVNFYIHKGIEFSLSSAIKTTSESYRQGAGFGYSCGYQDGEKAAKAPSVTPVGGYTANDMVEFAMNMIGQYVQGNTNIWNRSLLNESLPSPPVPEGAEVDPHKLWKEFMQDKRSPGYPNDVAYDAFLAGFAAGKGEGDAVEFYLWMNDEVNPFIKQGDKYIQACGNSTSWTLEQLYQLFKSKSTINV